MLFSGKSKTGVLISSQQLPQSLRGQLKQRGDINSSKFVLMTGTTCAHSYCLLHKFDSMDKIADVTMTPMNVLDEG